VDKVPVNLDGSIPAQLRERYTDFEYVGQGGMGRIVSAQDSVLDKRVAIKILPPTIVSKTAVVRFHQEAKAVSKLNHPNVVQVLDFGFASTGEPYLVMEHVKGETLDSLIAAQKALPLRLVINLAIQMCSALQHSHDFGIVHRDLKPGNIMLDENKNVKVLDFGLAKIIDRSKVDWRVTMPGEAMGSPLYMSPEQLRGEEVDARTDIFSLGLVLYKMATGTVPFEGENLMKILTGRFSQAPPVLPPNTENPLLGEALSVVIRNALQIDRDQRTATMIGLKNELLALEEIAEPPEEQVVEEQHRYAGKTLTRRGLIFAGLVALVGLGFSNLYPAIVDQLHPVPSSPHGRDLETHAIEQSSDEVVPGFVIDKATDFWTATSRVGDEDLNRLKGCAIEKLCLEANKHITIDGIKTISTLPLKRLNVRDTRLGDEIIPYLNKMNLQYLDIRSTRITNAGVESLLPSEALLELNLGDLKDVSNHCLPHVVKSFPNLISLVLTDTKVTGEGLKLLKPLRLSSLEVSILKLTDEDMDTIVMLHPRRIFIESNLITDKGLDKLLKLPVITELSVNFCDRVTPKKLEEFRRKYPLLKVEDPLPKKEKLEDTMELLKEPEPI